MPRDKAARKKEYFEQIVRLVQTYPRVIVVGVDHVGSKQLAGVRVALRGKAIILMGKNTKIRRCLTINEEKLPHADTLRSLVKLNVGFVFCIADPSEVRKIILNSRVPAPAKQGVLAPISVAIPAGPTGMDPSQTSFFQALGIPTKIVKGQIEIQNTVDIITAGNKVSASQSVLLQKLNIKPFSYGLKTQQVLDDGALYDASVLDLDDETLLKRFQIASNNIAAFSRQIGYPTAASVPHSLIAAFKNCVAMSLTADYSFPQMESIKAALLNPGAFAAAPAVEVSAPAAGKKAPPPKEESSDEDGGMMDLFG